MRRHESCVKRPKCEGCASDDSEVSLPAEPPKYLLIGLTKRCDYRCFFCCAETVRTDPKRERDLPIERFYSLQSAIESAGVIDLSSPGEVLLYPQVREALAFVAKHNRNRGIQFTTTGALLTEEIIRPVASRIDQIVVSLNASTPETYRRDMGSKLWERVLSNVRAVRRVLTRNQITLSFVAHGNNIHEFPDFVRLAAELDVRNVRAIPLRVNKPEFIYRSLWFHKERAQDLIGEACRIGQERGVSVSNLCETVQRMSAAIGQQCVMPFWGAYIDMNGNVLPCCHSNEQVMGNVYETGSFEEIWNGEKYRVLRKRSVFSSVSGVSEYARTRHGTTGQPHRGRS